MSAAAWVGVGVLGGAGAVLRVVLDTAITARAGTALPWGILAVNVSGSFALGLVGGRSAVVTVGLLGAYTTFSTWMLQARRLARDGRGGVAVAYLAGSVALGMLAVWAGRGLA